MLPGSTTSSFIAPGFGWMTETAGIASSCVVSFTAAAVWMRALMPQKTTAATTRTATASKSTTLSVRGRVGGGLGGTLTSICNYAPPMQHAEYRGNKKKRGESSENHPANDGASERSVLFAAFT